MAIQVKKVQNMSPRQNYLPNESCWGIFAIQFRVRMTTFFSLKETGFSPHARLCPQHFQYGIEFKPYRSLVRWVCFSLHFIDVQLTRSQTLKSAAYSSVNFYICTPPCNHPPRWSWSWPAPQQEAPVPHKVSSPFPTG